MERYRVSHKAFQFSSRMVSSPSVEVMKDHLPALTDGRGLARVDDNLSVVFVGVADDFGVQAEARRHVFNVRADFTPPLPAISIFTG